MDATATLAGVACLGAVVGTVAARFSIPNYPPVMVLQTVGAALLLAVALGAPRFLTAGAAAATGVAASSYLPFFVRPSGASAVFFLAMLTELLTLTAAAAVPAPARTGSDARTPGHRVGYLSPWFTAIVSVTALYLLFERLREEPAWIFPVVLVGGASAVVQARLMVVHHRLRVRAEAHRDEVAALNRQLAASAAQIARLKTTDAVNDLARTVIHELNNPLNFTAGNLQLLDELLKRREHEGENREEEADLLESSLDGIGTVIAVMDRLRGIQTHPSAPSDRDEAIPLRRVVDSVTSMIAREYPDATARLEIRVPSSLVVAAAAVDLHIICSNLVANALDASAPHGCVSLTAERNADGVTIVVEDDGPGPSEELGMRIFEPNVSTKPDGSGLGLALCRSLVGTYGGTITIDRIHDRTTRLRVTFPDPQRSNPSGTAHRAAPSQGTNHAEPQDDRR